MTHVVNLSTVFGHLPLVQRAAAATDDGYSQVESWWDFNSATPGASLEEFARSIQDAGVQLVALNSHGGDRAVGERGLASLPNRVPEFKESIAGIVSMAHRLGVAMFNVAAGNHDDVFSRTEQRDAAAANYRYAAETVAYFGGMILIEPLNAEANPAYPFTTGYDVVQFLREEVKTPNVRLLFDVFHLTSNGVDIHQAWADLHPFVGHVQLADYPGRGAPGTGGIDFDRFLAEVRASEYDGRISLEYLPGQN